MTASNAVYAPTSTLYSQKMIPLGSQLIACCKLAPTSVRQMRRHNYVIDRNEYLIFTLPESVNPWVYSLQFLFKSTNNSWRYERKREWVFFLNTVYVGELTLNRKTDQATTSSAMKYTKDLFLPVQISQIPQWNLD